MLVVFPYCSPEYEMCWAVQVMMGWSQRGNQKEINSDHNSKQQAAMTPIGLKCSSLHDDSVYAEITVYINKTPY